MSADSAAIALDDFAHWRFDTTSEAVIETSVIRLAHLFVRRFDTQLRTPDALHLALARRLGATLATFDVGAARAAQLLDIEVMT